MWVGVVKIQWTEVVDRTKDKCGCRSHISNLDSLSGSMMILDMKVRPNLFTDLKTEKYR